MGLVILAVILSAVVGLFVMVLSGGDDDGGCSTTRLSDGTGLTMCFDEDGNLER